jgi:hypothetical protein
MKKLAWLFGNALAGYMDFAIGAWIATALTLFIPTQLQWWYLLVGGILALLPDFDIILPILRESNKISGHHTTILHRPLFMILLATLVFWFIGGWYWGILAFVCVLWHFVHDIQGGIAWGWPVNKRLLYPFKKNVEHISHREWIEKFWLKPSALSVREISIGTAALVVAILFFIFSQTS